jgi:hypothetical protein
MTPRAAEEWSGRINSSPKVGKEHLGNGRQRPAAVGGAAAGEADTNQTALGWLRGTDPVEDAEWRALCNGVLQRELAKGRLAADVAAGRLTLAVPPRKLRPIFPAGPMARW